MNTLKKTFNLLILQLPSLAAASFLILITQNRAVLLKNCHVGHRQVIFALGNTFNSLHAAIKD